MRYAARIIFLVLGLCCTSAWADTLTLNNGTVLQGTVIPREDQYWIKLADGSTQLIDKSNVKSLVKGSPAPVAAPAPAPTGAAAPAPSSPPAGPTSDAFERIKARAAQVIFPVQAVKMWKTFLGSAPAAGDVAAAKYEMGVWQRLSDQGFERINGQWTSGKSVRALAAQAQSHLKQAREMLQANRSVQAVEELQAAMKIYPNSYVCAFELGYISLVTHEEAAALGYFQQALRLNPEATEACNNLAIAQWSQKQFEASVLSFGRAAALRDNVDVARNLILALQKLPPYMRSEPALRSAVDAAQILSSKYNFSVRDQRNGFVIMDIGRAGGSDNAGGDEAAPQPGSLSYGSGSFVTAEGVILTNRHVVKDAKTLTVLMSDGSRKTAEVIIIDKAQDLALIRVKDLKTPPPIVSFTSEKKPAEGAACFAMGYPLGAELGLTVKITQGIVTGENVAGTGADILVDAKINPGNSGGPLFNKYGQVMGIVTLKSKLSEDFDSYGMAISAPNILRFLAANKVKPKLADAGANVMNAEDVVKANKASIVCIIGTY